MGHSSSFCGHARFLPAISFAWDQLRAAEPDAHTRTYPALPFGFAKPLSPLCTESLYSLGLYFADESEFSTFFTPAPFLKDWLILDRNMLEPGTWRLYVKRRLHVCQDLPEPAWAAQSSWFHNQVLGQNQTTGHASKHFLGYIKLYYLQQGHLWMFVIENPETDDVDVAVKCVQTCSNATICQVAFVRQEPSLQNIVPSFYFWQRAPCTSPLVRPPSLTIVVFTPWGLQFWSEFAHSWQRDFHPVRVPFLDFSTEKCRT